ncbi:hypothetical protein [Desulfotomaculum nigrificans]|nr:hypothetical protein [Desulfotomaculum nigrificans]
MSDMLQQTFKPMSLGARFHDRTLKVAQAISGFDDSYRLIIY